jgi:hypothetical protein
VNANLVLAVLFCAASLNAQSGESHQHTVPEKLGTVVFPTSCTPEVQKRFVRSVALLHSFAYSAAGEAFQEVARADAECAMAHWGVAMSYYHQLWEPWISATDLKRGAAELDSVRGLVTSERERAYIDALRTYYGGEQQRPKEQRALDYTQAMAKVAHDYPTDGEAQIFYALALLATAPSTDRTHANQKHAAQILEPIWRKQPQHPGIVHYLIHAYDNAEMASRGVAVAREYSKVAPSAPHALHMPSHIFTRLGMWSDSVRSNKAARVSAHAQGDIGEELHTMDYLMYAYLQAGRVSEATNLLRELKAMNLDAGDFKVGYAMAAMPVRYAVEQGRWEEASQLEEMPQALAQHRAVRLWARGIGLARLGKTEDARRQVQAMQEAHDELETAGNNYWAKQVEIQIKEVEAWIAQAQNNEVQAVYLMRAAADAEDAVEKLPLTPGPIVPAREQLAAMLLEMNRPKEALLEYEGSLALAPGRRASLTGAARAAELSGDAAKMKKMNVALRELH